MMHFISDILDLLRGNAKKNLLTEIDFQIKISYYALRTKSDYSKHFIK